VTGTGRHPEAVPPPRPECRPGSPGLARSLGELLRPGDRIVWSPGAAEPTPVLREVLAAAADVGAELLVTLPLTDTLDAQVTDRLRVRCLGGLGTARRLRGADVLPVHWSALPRLLGRELPVDVAVVQVSPPDASGRHSLGVDASYTWAALHAARLRVAEVNARMPWTRGHDPVPTSLFDVVVHTDRPLPEPASPVPTDVERAVARHAAAFVDDGAVLQTGVGRAPGAVLELLADRRDLGVHTGLLDEAMWRLVRSGAVTNARKEVDRGWTVAGTLAGPPELYREAHAARVLVRDATVTHDVRALGALSRFTSVNSALEVDLSGQVNAERAGGRFVGAVGGLCDFVRGAALSDGGRSLLVLPATTSAGSSRIVPSLSDGTVTVSRSDVDVVVTEWGAAQLRGCDLPERARRLVDVAAPQFRDDLAAAARSSWGPAVRAPR
jgi:acyl-CoA hydrolase